MSHRHGLDGTVGQVWSGGLEIARGQWTSIVSEGGMSNGCSIMCPLDRLYNPNWSDDFEDMSE